MAYKERLQTNNLNLNSIKSDIQGLVNVIQTKDATATADKILNGYTAYVDGSKITGTYVAQGGNSLVWGGKNPVLIETKTLTVNIANDTTYSTTTPSTTAQIIFAASQSSYLQNTSNLDLVNYDYFIVFDMFTNPSYTSTPTTNHTLGEARKVVYAITRRWSTAAGTRSYNIVYTGLDISTNKYVASSTISWQTTTSYGFGFAPTAPALSNSTSGTPYLKLNTPAISVRTQSSYMAQNSWANIDAANTNVYMRWQLIRVDKNNNAGTAIEHNKAMILNSEFQNNMVG